MKYLKDFKFIKGKKFSEDINYYFKDCNNRELIISRKTGKFINNSESDYLLFTIIDNGEEFSKFYMYKNSEEFKSLTNIYPIVFNLGNITSFCSGCNTIVLKEQIMSIKNDKCVYCDLYACRGCKKMFPMIQLDKNRLCERCSKSE